MLKQVDMNIHTVFGDETVSRTCSRRGLQVSVDGQAAFSLSLYNPNTVVAQVGNIKSTIPSFYHMMSVRCFLTLSIWCCL